MLINVPGVQAQNPPVITGDLTNLAVLAGGNAALNVTVSGTGPFSYQWQFNGTNLPNTIITTVAGTNSAGFSGDGLAATNAKLNQPSDAAVDASGNVFISDANNYRIRKISPDGVITTVAGTGVSGFSGDGGFATNAMIKHPAGLAVDALGNLYFSDTSNSRVRKVDTNGIITTVAGTNSIGFFGDGGPATNAKLANPSGLAVDAAGDLYIADSSNNRIRMVDTNGVITTVAGTNVAGFFGDGGAATNARLANPSGVTVDGSGDFYIADTANNRIRKVGPAGIIFTVAGTNGAGFSGDGGNATNANLSSPLDVTADAYGYIFISDSANNRIRQVDANGVITTTAGNGSASFSGDGGTATNASLYHPEGVALDAIGNLFVADQYNNRVRKATLGRSPTLSFYDVTTNNAGNYAVIITNPYGSITSSIVSLTILSPPSIAAQPQDTVATNYDPAHFTVAVSGTEPLNYQWYFNTNRPIDGETNANLPFAGVTAAQTGNYFCIVTNAYGSVTSRIATLTVIVPPGIATQPTNQIVLAGSAVTLSVTPSGTGPFTYQWQLNGTNLPHRFGTNAPIYSPNIIMNVAGGSFAGFAGDGIQATSAALLSPYGVTADAFGNFFIADEFNNRIRKVNTNGIIATVAGNGPSGSNGSYSGDGIPATNANLNLPVGVAVDSFGNLFIADNWNNRIRKVDTNGIISTIAGTNGAGFSGDGGPAFGAKLNFPSAVAVDSHGNVFIADTGNNRIRRVDTNGIIMTIAGTNVAGYFGDGGAATVAGLRGPHGVALDGAGNCYIADTTNHCIRKVDINGIITTLAGNGTSGYSGDGGAATNAMLNWPYGLAVDAAGDIVVADYNNSRIRVINATGTITTLAGNGTLGNSGDNGAATNASLRYPTGVAFDVSGNLLIADEGNNRIREVDLWRVPTLMLNSVTPNNAGNYEVIVTSPYGSVTSSIVALTVVFPPAITAQPFNLTVTNGASANFQLTASGTVPLSYQWYFNSDAAITGETNSTLNIPYVDSSRTGSYFCIITNDYGNVTSRMVNLTIGQPPTITRQPVAQTVISGNTGILSTIVSGTGPFTYQWRFNGTNIPNNVITTVAGNGTNGFSGDGGTATNATLRSPNSVAVDALGNLFIADRSNFRIREVATNGIIGTVAGNGLSSYSGDGGAATNAGLYTPVSVAVDSFGDLFVADVNERRIRKINTDGIITTVTGNGIPGYSGDGGSATNASLGSPVDVAVDSAGNLFIVDTGAEVVRKVNASGIITTIAGNGTIGFSGDGSPATNANLSFPVAVAVDAFDNVFIADAANYRIRKVDGNGIITTVAGNGTNGFSGDGGLATNASLSSPSGVAVDAFGNVFISDSATNRIRQIDTNGIISTIAGNGNPAYSGDGGTATNASLHSPQRMAVDAAGNLFIADMQNNRLRKVALAGLPVLTLNGVSATNAGSYSVVITSPFGTVTSSNVTLTVLIPPSITGIFPHAGGGVTLNFTGGANQKYILQAATNLTPPIVWQTLSTNTAGADGNWQFTDTNANHSPAQFYRALLP